MSKLLKEAIADAGLVRETALANAKLALEEAFTPTIQSMLSKKIQQEEEGEEIEGGEEEVEGEEEGGEEVADDSGVAGASDDLANDTSTAELEIPSDEAPEEAPVAVEEPSEEGGEEAEVGGEEEVEEDEEVSEMEVEEDEEAEEDLDLESILRELEDGVDEDDEDPTLASEGEVEEDEESIEEGEDEVAVEDDEAGDEELDLESVLKALSEEDEEDDDDDDEEEEVEEVVNLRNELAEHKDCINKLRSELNEINLLNAKLLFTNKLFKSYDIDNAGKLRVVEMFDRTKNIREIKLVYATLQESFKNGKVSKKVKPITEGMASKPISSTKSAKSKTIVNEGSDFADRLKKLAGIN